jgi:Endonuclease/Exonuclease/phosphatase family
MRTRGIERAAPALLVCLLAASACGDDGDGGSDEGAADTTTTAAGSSGDSGAISVLAYNVAGLPQEISSESPEANIPLISPRLEPFDIVLTQEDFDWWGEAVATLDAVNYHDRLRADVTHEFQSTQHPGPEAVELLPADRPAPLSGDGLGTLSRFPIDERDRVPWIGCFGGADTSDGGAGDCLAMKGFSLTVITLADGVEVHVYNLHGEAGGSEADQALQAGGYAQLAEFIATNSEGAAVILGGDTNLHTETEHPDAAGGADIEIWDTFLETTGLIDACAATDCYQPHRIDKFAFRSGEGVDLEALTHRFLGDEFVDDAGEALSDHEPLEVTFAWTAT